MQLCALIEQALADLRQAAERGVAGAEERWQVVQGVWQEAEPDWDELSTFGEEPLAALFEL